jgi:hypothetical protein
VATVRADVERVKVNDANHPAGTLYPRMRPATRAQLEQLHRRRFCQGRRRNGLPTYSPCVKTQLASIQAATL